MLSGRKAILCVDDEVVILLAMKHELRRSFGDRYSIETARSAEDAEALIGTLEAEGISVALIICDWYMPGLRGDEFLRSLRAKRPLIKSILMTGQADDDVLVKAQAEAGVFACLTKPYRPEKLARTIEDCLGSAE